MPRVFEPPLVKKGPGSAVARNNKNYRHQRGDTATTKKIAVGSDVQEGAQEQTNHQKTRYIGREFADPMKRGSFASLKKKPKPATSNQAQQKESREPTRPLGAQALDREDGTGIVPNHALVVDTRYLRSDKTYAVGETVCSYFTEFLYTVVKRGAAPELLGTFTNQQEETNIQVKVEQFASVSGRRVPVFSTLCLTSAPQGDSTGEPISLPLALSAKYSWNLYSQAVEAIVRRHGAARSTKAISGPLDISILTSDVSLFCDTDQEAHLEGLKKFWEHVTSSYPESLLGCVRLVVARTSALAFADSTKQLDLTEKDLTIQYSKAFEGCITAISKRHDELDYDRLVRTDDTGSRVDFTLLVVDGSPVGFKSWSHQWLRQSLASSELSCHLEFDLPKTWDGAIGTFAFEASYHTFPFRICSTQASILLADLRYLSAAKLAVLQSIPLSSLDASLLYGFPLVLRPRLSEDLRRFQEMDALVRILFRRLQESETALLLVASPCADNGSKVLSEGEFQSEKQLFVLMAQEAPRASGLCSQSGLLFRYADADAFVAVATPFTKPNHIEEELRNQYTDYVEEALAGLECGPYSPFDAHCSTARGNTRGAQDMQKARSPHKRSVLGSQETPTNTAPASPTVMISTPTELTISSRPTGPRPHYKEEATNSVWDDATSVGSRLRLETFDAEEMGESPPNNYE